MIVKKNFSTIFDVLNFSGHCCHDAAVVIRTGEGPGAMGELGVKPPAGEPAVPVILALMMPG